MCQSKSLKVEHLFREVSRTKQTGTKKKVKEVKEKKRIAIEIVS